MSKIFFSILFFLSPSFIFAQKSSETLSLIVVGDVLPESSWREAFTPPEHFFVHVSSFFKEADEVFINLEEPITTSTAKTPLKNPKSVAMGKDFILAARNPIWPKVLKESGVTIVNCANNHMGDYGPRGVRDTLDQLHFYGLKTVGAGKNFQEAAQFLKVEKQGIKIAFLGFTDVCPDGFVATEKQAGVATSKDLKTLLSLIQSAKKWADYVVVMMHWGEHASTRVNQRQKMLARKMVSVGADFIFGMHSHFLQAVEFIQKKPVFYSLGNFAFPSRKRLAQESVLVKIIFAKELKPKIEVLPVLISETGQPRMVQGEKTGNQILERWSKLCKPFGTMLKRNRNGTSEVSPLSKNY